MTGGWRGRGDHLFLFLGRPAASQRRLAAIAVPGQHVGRGHRKRGGRHPGGAGASGLRCWPGHIGSRRTSGNSTGAVSGGTGTTSTSVPAAAAHVAISPAIVTGSAGLPRAATA